jgi:hypothetical protein
MSVQNQAAPATNTTGPLCFLHIPKSAGQSFHEALIATHGVAAVSARRCDWTQFASFDAFESLPGPIRTTVVADDDELLAMSQLEVVSGHFALRNLLRLTTPDRIATILREPRARLLSLYAYFRLSPRLLDAWGPYDIMRHGLRPLDEFLAETEIAVETDNILCRMLLDGDPRLPDGAFIAAEDVDGLTADACDRLGEIGLVEILERGRPAWERFGSFFGVDGEPERSNVTPEESSGVAALPRLGPVTEQTIALLEQRNAIDSRIYRWVLERDGLTEQEARRGCDAAFGDQLMRLGNIAGSRAAAAETLQATLDARDAALRAAEEDLARHRAWLAGIVGSASWRLTAPLRAAKRRLQ